MLNKVLDESSTLVLNGRMDRTEQAREFIRSRRGKWPEMVEATGLNYQWISKFAQGVIKDPRARFIDVVLEYQAARSNEAA